MASISIVRTFELLDAILEVGYPRVMEFFHVIFLNMKRIFRHFLNAQKSRGLCMVVYLRFILDPQHLSLALQLREVDAISYMIPAT